MLRPLLGAIKQALEENKLTKRELEELNDDTENFAKEAFELLYIKSPSTERLWSKATIKNTFLIKGLIYIVATTRSKKA